MDSEKSVAIWFVPLLGRWFGESIQILLKISPNISYTSSPLSYHIISHHIPSYPIISHPSLIQNRHFLLSLSAFPRIRSSCPGFQGLSLAFMAAMCLGVSRLWRSGDRRLPRLSWKNTLRMVDFGGFRRISMCLFPFLGDCLLFLAPNMVPLGD
jgi:hypothetical protein